MVVFLTGNVFYYLVFSTNTVTNNLVFLTFPPYTAFSFIEIMNAEAAYTAGHGTLSAPKATVKPASSRSAPPLFRLPAYFNFLAQGLHKTLPY